MKPEQDDRLEAGGDLGSPREFSVERLQQPEIVGEVRNPLLETVRRLWWRAIDRVCSFFVLIRLRIFHRIRGPEPPTPADLQREADNERFVRAFPVASEAMEPRQCHAGQNRDDEIGTPYRLRQSTTILLRFRLFQREAPGLSLDLVPCREVKSYRLRQ
jgi:hypothetical protein